MSKLNKAIANLELVSKRAARGIAFSSELTEAKVQVLDQVDVLRTALEVIGTGSTSQPQFVATAALVETEIWERFPTKEEMKQGLLYPDPELCKFYQCSTYPELVTAMEAHIKSLQEKLPETPGLRPTKVREG